MSEVNYEDKAKDLALRLIDAQDNNRKSQELLNVVVTELSQLYKGGKDAQQVTVRDLLDDVRNQCNGVVEE